MDPEWEIETDASLMGWGAHSRRREFTGECWSPEEKTLHINALQLMAAKFGIQAFCKQSNVSSVLLKTDNSTVVSCIHRMGGTKSPLLVELARELWQWCLTRKIQLRAQHLPGIQDFTADFLSRNLRDRTDWMMDMELFRMINRSLGPLQVDLFDTRFSTCLPRFFSWRPDPEAEATDALLQDWSGIIGYANPPWCLNSRVLLKAKSQGITLVIIVSYWPTQAWFPQLVSMLVDYPIQLPLGPEISIPSPNCEEMLIYQGQV